MRILAHLRELDESQKDWQRYQSISLEDLKKDRDKRNMVLHAMLVSIQAAIDIATSLIAKEGLGKPATYRETFEILGQAGLISEELAEELSDLAGFRNVLVHIYWQLDFDQVYGILQNDLKTLKSFLQEVKGLLAQDLSTE
ncbi:type VII toxin-antitoxin system HepT family RNase toxin [Methanosarcina mazei]|nr:DUF86 domain-containing protein [Methanosarcina mazei]AGF96887.1 hypothetical protein MmTuc01_1521 [Methanosarcina mazei Tuc01]AKB42109.1 hypothetical protein MSMAW_3118 [Methanosarcina mazei WWM610]AKB69739.1 hypothetical protein MSMAL_3196 [Methanosarcina mazei LYC]AKB73105.1 hypothetical protein MSMAC_3215 [Methanosarcina mazei C16]KKG00039.1 hypothetical protein DU40_16630 [Methanosarcina mazei]